MSPIAIRSVMRGLRRHLTGLALGGAVAAHHSAIAMGEMHHDGTSAAIEVCVGAFTAVEQRSPPLRSGFSGWAAGPRSPG